jgi:endonuclease-8
VAEFQSGQTAPPIGPDLLAESFDVDDAVKRFRAQGASEIGDVLLNQRVLAGVGNIYKSEVLFACGVNPFTHVDALSDEHLARIASKSRLMLQHEAIRARRLVYRRAGQPCRKCGTAIEMRRQGPDARSSYWCPRCQP